jgi:DNA-binding NtrC family response regulator
LNILQIRIPALRERGPEDIKVLANYFLKKNNPLFQLTPDALNTLTSYNWPGNVRELENTIQRALHVCKNSKITSEDLGLANLPKTGIKGSFGTIQQMEEKMIADVLIENKSNMALASRQLGISRATLYRKVKQYGLDRSQDTR